MPTRRQILMGAAALPFAARVAAAPEDWPARLIEAARAQIGVTVIYDGAYAQIAYPMGDVPRERGVCTDVLVRAYRDALGLDLQALVHQDMRANFTKYPQNWGLSRPDTNIDHRRVPNLRTYFTRVGASLPLDPAALEPGDLVTMMLPGNLPHIAIVSDRLTADETRPLILHNINRGTQEEDRLTAAPLTGRYRWAG